MLPTRLLLQQSARITLFTRQSCSLCETAKAVIQKVGKCRHFDYREVDVMSKGQEQWKAAYEFDAPVAHIQQVLHTYAKPDKVTDVGRLFHRFHQAQVEKLLDDAEGRS